jgi:orotate phosphoribosyltransferase
MKVIYRQNNQLKFNHQGLANQISRILTAEIIGLSIGAMPHNAAISGRCHPAIFLRKQKK